MEVVRGLSAELGCLHAALAHLPRLPHRRLTIRTIMMATSSTWVVEGAKEAGCPKMLSKKASCWRSVGPTACSTGLPPAFWVARRANRPYAICVRGSGRQGGWGIRPVEGAEMAQRRRCHTHLELAEGQDRHKDVNHGAPDEGQRAADHRGGLHRGASPRRWAGGGSSGWRGGRGKCGLLLRVWMRVGQQHACSIARGCESVSPPCDAQRRVSALRFRRWQAKPAQNPMRRLMVMRLKQCRQPPASWRLLAAAAALCVGVIAPRTVHFFRPAAFAAPWQGS